MASELDFEQLVDRYYRPLYQFAFSLSRTEADACDLTQQTFYVLQTKGHQLRDPEKVKTWLFTTLHRAYLNSVRRQNRFPQIELELANNELPAVPAASLELLDSDRVLEALRKVDQPHQAAIALFYLEDYSYKQIAEILDVPIGTVKSRLSRGIAQLQQILSDVPARAAMVGRKPHD